MCAWLASWLAPERGPDLQEQHGVGQAGKADEMPTVETHILDSGRRRVVFGEPGVPPVAPALCNAIFALTGKRVRKLPIRPEDLKRA
jgi:CO/xanthine dehydrogenase Mo-binding subunit